MPEYLTFHAPPQRRPVAEASRGALAVVLRAAGGALDRLAHRVEGRRIPAVLPRASGTIEFHAEAGAPEGALYVDGRLVGWIGGVNRL